MEGRSKTTAITVWRERWQETVRSKTNGNGRAPLLFPTPCPTLLPECWLCSPIMIPTHNKTLSEELTQVDSRDKFNLVRVCYYFLHIPLVLVCYCIMIFSLLFQMYRIASSFQTFKEFLKYPVCKQRIFL